ncbi:Hpt domain-containing protein [Novosphingobium sp.]|uniref:Hpt domain-containing protein n=1 Tax=Novosphingobium sp. TaxID=1874826 RepID=UPI001EB22190|nr:Hpt domain-containing protein [Novosphingobium sp.]MBK6801102.1 Hpt domain-containing protein [Novosphingobium sp.]MBK9011660.1 Hpt domain-containing protein [Novosphingobium sp.]
MAYEAGALDATLAAAAGEDSALFAELRQAFAESLARQVDLLRRSRCDGNWQMAALRLKGLAASFHADQLIVLADEALEAAPGEPAVVRRLQAFLDDFARG